MKQKRLKREGKKLTLFTFAQNIANELELAGRERTKEVYFSAINSFKEFRKGKDITFDMLSNGLMLSYESYLRDKGLCSNTSSFYIRAIRAIYKKAVDRGLVVQSFPFKGVYTGVDETVKRALKIELLKKIKHLHLSGSLQFARDIFLFSFYTRGMSFVDMAFLKRDNLADGVLHYRRRKTGKLISVKWEDCMQDIVDKYGDAESQYLLPLISENTTNIRQSYLNAAHTINRNLKIIGKMLLIRHSLTMYVARHTWATLAKNNDIPIYMISESLGHESIKTTKIYLASVDNVAVDNANKILINLL